MARIASDASLSFEGTAEDDQGSTLPASALSWYLGNRLLGHGQTLNDVQLPPGHDRVTLIARDRLGRAGRTIVPVNVLAVTPSTTALSAPTRISPQARILALAIAVRGSAWLAIGGQRWRVGSIARTVGVAITPGRGPLRLHLKLTTAGSSKAIAFVLQAARG